MLRNDTIQQDNSTKVQALEKDVFYYRNANKELKTKLREIVAMNHRLSKSLQEKQNSNMIISENESNIPDENSRKEENIPAFPVAVE